EDEKNDGTDVSDSVDTDSDDTDIDMSAFDRHKIRWSKKTKFEPYLPIFDGEFTLKDDINLPKYRSLYDFFNLFLTTEIVDYIVGQSNLYRTQQNFKREPMTHLDLYRLIGFLFYASLIKLPSKPDYWSAAYGCETVIKNITRNWVEELLRSLHFGDNTLRTNLDDKIQPLIVLFNDRCGSMVNQEQCISIDEQMVGYKGANACTLVVQPVASSHTTASYSHQTRSTHQNNENDEKSVERCDDIKRYGKSGMVVLDLLEGVPKGSHVFVDNYFASTALLHQMTTLGYGLTCTLKSSRIGNCPIESEKSMKKHSRGYYDYLVSNDKNMILVAWQDNRRVLMGSNFVGVEPVIQLSRWNKQKHKKTNVDAPQIVNIYNQHMGGVDTVDMLCALHPIPFRSKKWYMRIAWRIFDLMVINAWVLWKHVTPNDERTSRSSRLFSFKMAIANLMLQEPTAIERRISKALARQHSSSESDNDGNNFSQPKRKKRESALNVSIISRFDGLEHWPQLQQNVRLRCKNEACKLKTNVFCSKCKVHLCLNVTRNCFKEYHSKK
ncbi:unnamed protein product, partial [Didymodactylos carnosus]